MTDTSELYTGLTGNTIYQQHDAAFRDVAAYAIVYRGKFVAKIAFKFPRDGAGRLYAYVHWLGSPMVRGFASGGGYDKRSAALASAAEKIRTANNASLAELAFIVLCRQDDGMSWDDRLRRDNFEVHHVV